VFAQRGVVLGLGVEEGAGRVVEFFSIGWMPVRLA
jgi:hypothetical protein